MAKYTNSPFGRMSGEVAGQIATSWKGLGIIRAKASSVNQPNSSAQRNQKTAFGIAAHLTSIFTSIIKASYSLNYRHKTACNVFMGNLLCSGCIDAESGIVDYTKMALSHGELCPLENVAITNDTQKLNLTWNNNAGSYNSKATDTVHVVVFDENREYFLNDMSTQRDDTSCSILLSESWKDHRLAVFVFTSNDDEAYSNCHSFVIDSAV